MNPSWYPDDDLIKNSNIHQMMLKNGFVDYNLFWKWSATERIAFWEQTVKNLNLKFDQNYTTFLDISQGVEQAHWLKGALLNIADSCFQNEKDGHRGDLSGGKWKPGKGKSAIA